MKKLTAFILAMLLASTAVVGCERDEPHETPNETTQSEASTETQTQMEEIINASNQENSQGGFTITGEKHYYRGNSFYDQYTEYSAGDVLILTVTNETEIDYKAKLTVTYLDENGEKINAQSKTFDRFMGGYTNYFVFQPRKKFVSYTCDLTLTELNEEEKAELLVDKLTLTYEGTRERITVDMMALNDGLFKETPQLLGQTNITWSEPVPLYNVHYLFVLFDNTGDVYLICPFGAQTNMLNTVSDYTIYSEQEHRSKVIMPEELKGELDYLVFPVRFDPVKEDGTN